MRDTTRKVMCDLTRHTHERVMSTSHVMVYVTHDTIQFVTYIRRVMSHMTVDESCHDIRHTWHDTVRDIYSTSHVTHDCRRVMSWYTSHMTRVMTRRHDMACRRVMSHMTWYTWHDPVRRWIARCESFVCATSHVTYDISCHELYSVICDMTRHTPKRSTWYITSRTV